MEAEQDNFILSIEASQKVCSVAVHQNGKLLASNAIFSDKSASSTLTPQIEQLLLNCNLLPTNLTAIAVAKGPGSYTGLRIAVSSAKGLSMALEKPLIGVNTLEAMAAQICSYFPENYLLCPMLDARRMEVYCSIFDTQLKTIVETNAQVIDEQSFFEYLVNHKIVFFGDGAAKCKSIFANNKNAIFLEKEIFPIAETVGKLAFQQFEIGNFENLVTFEPFYLKDFVGNVKVEK